jgi:hypothetical protein
MDVVGRLLATTKTRGGRQRQLFLKAVAALLDFLTDDLNFGTVP